MKKLLIIFMLFSLAFVSCEEDEVIPSDSSLTKANISGYVNLYEEDGSAATQDEMIVMLESESGIGGFYGETEKDGEFLILNALYHHNYTIAYTKNGYGTYKKYGFNHENTGGVGHITEAPSLSKKSTTIVNQIDAEVSGETVELEVSISSLKTKGNRYIRFLFHTISEISPKTFSHYTGRFTMTSNHHTLTLTKEYLQEIGLISGVKYYVQGYGASYYSNGYFDDYATKYILPNLGYDEENAISRDSFIMP